MITCVESETHVFFADIFARDVFHFFDFDDSLLLALLVRTRDVVSASHHFEADVSVHAVFAESTSTVVDRRHLPGAV